MSFGEIAGKVLSNMGPGLLSGIGKALEPDPQKPKMIPDAPDPTKPSTARPNSFKNGGVVQKTGLALVHKGETVVPVKNETVKLSHHRVVMHLNKGGLHRALHVPEDEDIPEDKLEAARDSKNPHVREMANLAHTFKSWHHGK
jgi:hypothetical protein